MLRFGRERVTPGFCHSTEEEITQLVFSAAELGFIYYYYSDSGNTRNSEDISAAT